jgi:hypothetical protein
LAPRCWFSCICDPRPRHRPPATSSGIFSKPRTAALHDQPQARIFLGTTGISNAVKQFLWNVSLLLLDAPKIKASSKPALISDFTPIIVIESLVA